AADFARGAERCAAGAPNVPDRRGSFGRGGPPPLAQALADVRRDAALGMAAAEDVGARRELERRIARVDALVRELEGLPDERARRSAVEAFRALLDLHGEVLDRMLELAGPEVTDRLAGDPAVAGLLLLHGIHPVPFEDRVQRALDGVRPYLGSHGG